MHGTEWGDTFVSYDDCSEDFLKAATIFDWIDPIVDVALMVAGKVPIFVPHSWRHMAADALCVEPHTYDITHDCWIFMVEDQQFAHMTLEWAGVPYL